MTDRSASFPLNREHPIIVRHVSFHWRWFLPMFCDNNSDSAVGDGRQVLMWHRWVLVPLIVFYRFFSLPLWTSFLHSQGLFCYFCCSKIQETWNVCFPKYTSESMAITSWSHRTPSCLKHPHEVSVLWRKLRTVFGGNRSRDNYINVFTSLVIGRLSVKTIYLLFDPTFLYLISVLGYSNCFFLDGL